MWRINYAYGKVFTILNKNIGSNIFGKSSLSQWTIERNPNFCRLLEAITLKIADIVSNCSNLKAFDIDVILDNDTGQFYFLELNQAFSMNENNCKKYLNI